jgi:hypothetical protein
MFQELYMWYMIHASEGGAEPTYPAAPQENPNGSTRPMSLP